MGRRGGAKTAANRHGRGRALLAVLMLAPALAACGGSSDDDGAAPTEPAPAAAIPAPELQAVPPPAIAPAAAPGPDVAPAAAEPIAALQPAAESPPPAPAAASALPEMVAAPPGQPAVLPADAPPAAPPAVAPEPVAGTELPLDPDLRRRIAGADAAAGQADGALCMACHTVAEGAASLIGPNLYGVVGAPVARSEGFAYSPAMAALRDAGATWSFERLDAFLADPSAVVPGTRMTMAGIADTAARARVIAWLRSLAAEPVPVMAQGMAAVGNRLPGLDPIVFSEEQVQPGRDYYTRVCARCHGSDFLGRIDEREWGSGPPMVGPLFERDWYDRTVWDLLDFMRNRVDPEFHPPMAEERYAQVLAYIFEQQGFHPGPDPLPLDQATLERMGFWQ